MNGHGSRVAVISADEEHNEGAERFHREPRSTTAHADLSQSYRGGEFVTLCTCGSEATGQTPDDADAAHMEHAANR